MTTTGPPRTTGWRERLGGALFLVTGAALVVHILVGLPLWLTVFGGIAMATSIYLWAGPAVNPLVARRIRLGLVSGAVATVCYDSARMLFVTLTDASVRPFDTWRLFGLALVGPGAAHWAYWAAGTAYHVTNGLLFAVAYTIWFADRGPLWGIGYAMVLEAFMLGLFPGWAHVKAFGEFTQMSVLGHVVYGAVLGFLARRLTRVPRVEVSTP